MYRFADRLISNCEFICAASSTQYVPRKYDRQKKDDHKEKYDRKKKIDRHRSIPKNTSKKYKQEDTITYRDIYL